MDLENRNSALQEELSLSPAKRAAMQSDWVPRAPAAHVLTGHRAAITRVSFHPQYSILASASEDATVKIWDWETGEFERTLKGHTKSVVDVDFDHKGQLLGQSDHSPLSSLTFPSDVLQRPLHQDLGLHKRLEKHKDVSWSRALRIYRPLHAW